MLTPRALSLRGCFGGGAGVVDSRLLSCVGDFLLLLSAVAIVGCTMSAVRFWFVLYMPFGGEEKGFPFP